MSDRRAEPRHPIPGELPGEVTIIEPLRLIEISGGGAKIEVETPLVPESLHAFRFRLPERPVVVTARIVYCRITDLTSEAIVYCAGIEFTAVPPHVKEAIAAYIDRLEAARTPDGLPGPHPVPTSKLR
jgi:hypothetical protein